MKGEASCGCQTGSGLKTADVMIRLMVPEDVPQVAEIEKELFSEPWSENGFLTSLQSKDTLYLTALKNNRVIGYCGFLQSFDEADITNVAVSRENQNAGTAYKMLLALMEQGKKRGVERFTLEVRVGNLPAVHLYEKLGFVSAGIRRNFYAKPVEDALIMWTEGEVKVLPGSEQL